MSRHAIIAALAVVRIQGHPAAASEYVYATGDKLNLALAVDSFAGISDLVTLGVGATPVDLSTVQFLGPSSPTKHFRLSSVQSSEDYESAFSVSAQAQGSYGAFSGSASANYMQSKMLTSKSSLYFMNFEYQVGTVTLNPQANLTSAALSLLNKDPERFITSYGRYYVHGLTLGCQATATVTITSKTEYDKKDLDVKAAASYSTMISSSDNFTSHMKDQKGFDSLSTEVFTFGGDVPAAISDLGRVQKEIVDAMDTGGKCTRDNAVVTRAIVRSWLSFPPIADAAAADPTITKALTPTTMMLPEVLARLSNIRMKTNTWLSLADKCHGNVFSCVTKQWDEPTDTRRTLYQGAYSELLNFRNTLDHTNEESLSNQSLILSFETALEATYQKYLKPAQNLTPFTFHFNVRVLNWFDNYEDPPPWGTNNLLGEFTIDPNHQDTESAPVEWSGPLYLDNGHANCRHFFGTFKASYQDEKLEIWQWWKRVCGPEGTCDPAVFQPGGDMHGSTDFDKRVRTKYSFTVTYGKNAKGTDEEANATILI